MLEEVSAGLEEVRPGRELFVRRAVLSPTPPNNPVVIEFTSDPVTKQKKSRPRTPKENVRNLRLQLVLVHGLCGTQEQFNLLLQSLSERLDEHGMLETTETNKTGEVETITRTILEIHCLMYDMVGCGQSPVINNKAAYCKTETMADLKQLMETYLNKSDPTHVLGHSYGPSIFLSMLSESVTNNANKKRQPDEETTSTQQSHASTTKRQQEEPVEPEQDRTVGEPKSAAQQKLPQPPSHDLLQRFNIHGMVFISSAIRTPALPFVDGGAFLIRKLPVIVLKLLNSRLTTNFVETAVLEENSVVQQMLKWQCESNDLRAVQAWHSQTKWTTVDEVQNILKAKKIPTLVVHGTFDGILPFLAGQELAQAMQPLTSMHFVTLQNSSHMGLLEEPETIGQAVWDFIQDKVVSATMMAEEEAASASADDLTNPSPVSPPAGCCSCTAEPC